jgi:lysophospholipase L1-like esterase
MSPTAYRFLLPFLLLVVAPLRADPPVAASAATTTPAPAATPALKGPARWEKDIASFEAQDRKNPPKKGGIVFIGSSSIRMWKTLAEDFPHHRVVNRGFGGSEVSDSLHFAERIIFPHEPRMIVMYAGGNDINAKKEPEQVLTGVKAFVEKVRARLPDVEIAYISIAGNPARWKQIDKVRKANALVAEYCSQTPKMKFIDVFPAMMGPDSLPKPDIFLTDNLHMNPAGYKIWTEVVAKYLPPPDKP